MVGNSISLVGEGLPSTHVSQMPACEGHMSVRGDEMEAQGKSTVNMAAEKDGGEARQST